MRVTEQTYTQRPCVTLIHYLPPVTHRAAFFIGGGPQLVAPAIVHAGADRSRLRTASAGTVSLRLGVISRNLARFGVEAW